MCRSRSTCSKCSSHAKNVSIFPGTRFCSCNVLILFSDLGDALEYILKSNKKLFWQLLRELENGEDLKFKVYFVARTNIYVYAGGVYYFHKYCDCQYQEIIAEDITSVFVYHNWAARGFLSGIFPVCLASDNKII